MQIYHRFVWIHMTISCCSTDLWMLADTFVQILQQQLCATAGTGPGWYGLVGQACVLSNCGLYNYKLVFSSKSCNLFSHSSGKCSPTWQIRQSVLIWGGTHRHDIFVLAWEDASETTKAFSEGQIIQEALVLLTQLCNFITVSKRPRP